MAAMDKGDLNSECARKLRSVSNKFSYEMQDINYIRPVHLTVYSYLDRVIFLLDQDVAIIFGSVGEGIQYPYIICQDRDVDVIRIYPRTRAVQDASERDLYDRQTYVYLIESNENVCPPGYCVLRMLNDGSSPKLQLFHVYKELYGEKYILSSASRAVARVQIIINKDLNESVTLGDIFERGPSISSMVSGLEIRSTLINSFEINVNKIDYVSVIYCPKWPSCALEWVTRTRLYGWPSQQQISDIVRKGIYLAPVGSKQSEFQDIQWRYSFNEAEKTLVRSFNFTQVKCYILLKMLIREKVTPRFKDDVISSYHLKTLMFWAIEQTNPQLWVSCNLVELVFRVLHTLFLRVRNLFCSSYFIPDENIFAGKVTPTNMESVSHILSNIISEGWVALTRLSYFARDVDFIQRLYQDNDMAYAEENTMEQNITMSRVAEFCFYKLKLNSMLKYLNVACSCNINETDKIDANFNEVIYELLLEIQLSGDNIDEEILRSCIAFVRCSYGTHLLSLALCPRVESTENEMRKKLGIVYTHHSYKSNQVDCQAKHANYTYITGDFHSTIAIARTLLNRYAKFPLHPPSVLGNMLASYQCYEQVILNVLSNGINIENIFDNIYKGGCLIFLKNEIYALPDDARVEMFHVVGAGNNVQTECRLWFELSPFLYVAYLAFLVNVESGHQDNAEASLRIMESMCSTLPAEDNESSSLNLLGVCYLKMREPDKAMTTFCSSVRRKRNNAAVWHVARLLWRKLRNRWMETREK
ncbi:hypothetical protein CHS0354_040446 [Potamilus streckersoni]|uniref:Mab-21-like HhH/H2TH-like domain-containing protein n=1 Tax=Potamilus streckersoni TaxID=2493646 RepID=A0AAE0T032_9BIVA|nr:hypothetical protein CHS0354_040446 [Potamilus streckersoni]